MENQIKFELVEAIRDITARHPNWTIDIKEISIYKTDNLN